MATAVFVDLSLENWPHGTNIYALSEPFNSNDVIAVLVQPTGTSIIPATVAGANVPDPNGMGFIAHRTWYPPIEHEMALAQLGFTLTESEDA